MQKENLQILSLSIIIFTENEVLRVWFLRVFVVYGYSTFLKHIVCFAEYI